MQGKLYSGSASIYEDEARLLFDYFSAAADRIIEDEDRVTSRIKDTEGRLSTCRRDIVMHSVISIILLIFACGLTIYAVLNGGASLALAGKIAIVAIVIIAFIVIIADVRSIGRLKKAVSDLKEEFSGIRRDYKVTKLGVAYVPVAKKVPFDNQSITVDLSGAVKDEDFEMISIHEPDRFEEDVHSFKEHISSVPFVEGSSMTSNVDTSDLSVSMQEVPMYDYLSELDKDIRRIDDDLGNVDRKAVSLPVIPPQSETMEFLKTCGTSQPEGYPVVDVFDSSFIDPKVETLLEIYRKRSVNADTGDRKALEDLIALIGVSTEAIAGSKMSCCNAILDYNNGIFANVLKSPYRNYSPKLEAETIEEIKGMTFDFTDMSENYRPFRFRDSSLMHFDLYSDTWVDETGARTSMPFGMHQIQEEIFMPIVNSLMEENRLERRKIYERIQTQKMDYLNKWHTETQDFYGRNRDTADTLKSSIIEALSTYNSAYATWKAIKDTIQRMDEQQALVGGKVESDQGTAASMILSAEQVNSNFEELEKSFDEYMDRLQDDIDEKADRFGKVTYYEALLYASEAQRTAIASSNITKLDGRRLKVAKVSPYLAQYGDLPPQPSVEEEVYQMMDLNLAEEARNLVNGLNGSAEADDEGGKGGE